MFQVRAFLRVAALAVVGMFVLPTTASAGITVQPAQVLSTDHVLRDAHAVLCGSHAMLRDAAP